MAGTTRPLLLAALLVLRVSQLDAFLVPAPRWPSTTSSKNPRYGLGLGLLPATSGRASERLQGIGEAAARRGALRGLKASSKPHGGDQGVVKKVVVVGAGAGGMALAGRLKKARPEWDVELLEKNKKLGGRMATEARGGFRFDTGPSLLLAPDIYREAFDAVGARMEDHVRLVQVDPAYRCFLGDGSNVTVSGDLVAMREQLEAIEPGSFPRYLAYLKEATHNYESGFASRPFASKDNSWGDYLAPENLALLKVFDPTNLIKSHAARLAEFFTDPRLIELFSFQDLYVGLSPSEAPAIFSLLQYLEIVKGIWYPVGGFDTVRAGLEAAVDSIVVAKGGLLSGDTVKKVVLVDATEIPADIVVSNVDLPFTYAHLLHEQGSTNEEGSRDQGSTTKEEFHAEGSENKEGPRVRAGGQDADRLAGLDYSSGVVSFYWPLRALPPGSGPDPVREGLCHHSIFMSGKGAASWEALFRGDADLPLDPSFYVATPSISDPSAAPAGGHSVMVLVPCGCMPEDRASPALYEKVVEDAREAVLARLERQGVPIRERVAWEDEEVWTPDDWRTKYSLFRGAAFGLSHRLSQLVIFRPPNRDPKVGNLFFVGASTTPGNGVPLVLASARMTAAHILSLF